MDFIHIHHCIGKNKKMEVYPDFDTSKSNDIMIRGGKFYAVWNDETQLWSTDEYSVSQIIDSELYKYCEEHKEFLGNDISIKLASSYSSGTWTKYKKYIASLPDNSHQLDDRIIFANTEVKKKDYISRKLPYNLEDMPCVAYDELMETLYDEENRRKIEWAIGSIISGDSKNIQKFLVLYGSAGTGKSTVLNIIQKLFEGYYTTFEAKALTTTSNTFATEIFASNPLVAIQHDGDLSRIEDNSKLNSIVSHEEVIIHEKYKSGYSMRINCFLFMGTNKPVKITDAKSGLIRRLIDVRPTGNIIPKKRYDALFTQIDFELGAIANRCLHVYREFGKNYYNSYRPVDMMYKTDVFFNFVEDQYFIFKDQDGVSLTQAYALYKEYCDSSGAEFKLPRYKFREELKDYFYDFKDVYRDTEGKQIRSYYIGFKADKFKKEFDEVPIKLEPSLVLDKTESLFDELYSNQPAQYANNEGTPNKKWKDVKTTLGNLNTKRLHYVKVPENHIVIDFDLKDDNGEKSYEKNIEAASDWPRTYAELSKSGKGVHLHYIYGGDVTELSRLYSKDVEIKVFTGDSSLRRKLTKCNDIPIATINSGLPLRERKKGMLDFKAVEDEKHLRDIIKKALAKEVHANTKPNVDFIFKLLTDAYENGIKYDVRDLRPHIMAFCLGSTNNSDYCIKLYSKMKFCSEDIENISIEAEDTTIIFYDVEVFPNLLLVNWKYQGKEKPVVRMINPSPQEIEKILKYRLIGFNNRRYDNHILYARYLGYSIEEIFNLSQKIISGSKNAFFGPAYNLSYTDVYDFCAKKQSLKKWEIELGIHHQELGLPWDEPVPEEMWTKVAEYCDNDVIATEAVFDANQADFNARKILSELSGLTLNDTTNAHTIKIIFGDNKNPQSDFVYTDLSEMFPGYKYDRGVSTYRGEVTGEGGYVYAEPGMYTNVALLDIASMHPTSIECLNLFGPYTKNFSDIKKARIHIKHQEFDKVKKMFNSKLALYLKDEEASDALAYALKIAINSVYGLTSAKFDNPCKDPRNIDNIVAKRGALFMIDLKHAVQEKGYQVAHIKTDSIKIPEATPEIISFVMDFGKKYGYTFEHEATYSKMCLINDAVYIAQYADGKHAGEWTPTGAEFAVPYVFKTMFSHEPVEFKDLCETKTVTSALYLDMNENLPNVEVEEKELAKLKKKIKDGELISEEKIKELEDIIATGHNYIFVGKAGSFCPIKPGCGGGLLMRENHGSFAAATNSKGYRWLESEMVTNLNKKQDIDESYFIEMVNTAIDDISQFGDYEWFVS